MSNIIYDFLVESVLFKGLESNYSNISLHDLIIEHNKYKVYVDQNIEQIKNESTNSAHDYSMTAPISLTDVCTSIDEISRGALFLDRYIVDDPLYHQDYNNLDTLNYGRIIHKSDLLSETDIKREIYNSCLFLKNLTPLVRVGVEYIKIMPLSKDSVFSNLESINIPDLSLDHIDDKAFDWMVNKLKTYKNVGTELHPLNEIVNHISLMFEDDNIVFSAVYQKSRPILYDSVGNPIKAVLFETLPSESEFKSWVIEEKIKAIRDKFKQVLLCHSISEELNKAVAERFTNWSTTDG